MTNRPTAKDNAKRFASVIQALHACQTACEHCATESGKNGHAEVMARCMGLCTDCAEYCAITRRFLERNSEFAELLLEDCAEICHQCAEECDHHRQGHCSACATACRACVDACLKVAGVEAVTAEPTVF
ncbi:four-helix bundle copper-binding protein [Ralstonia insidiosa]|jgi:hypothetical protein|uniref:Four-helix bundle copper-binding protein n=1 Tax=Ralstonia insidiosa TaxID=190721 RepID=A0A192A5J4_9RALS|nr:MULTISPECIES: four-helix bundle copper-binding protein [Ralstonia]ANH76300.1 hypothetical protein ACS15_5160 [Ralstonia insidiosa]ANJ75521.1 four-helix bundle copper-binding protein [Ralstonia insidiosa]EPX99281.1 hypothetical protein C404_04800 [Ralstonia sp. AU12-08]KAB0469688.1 four-helix bundle copper-binding protein [Ralstonia insidiosa]MBY4708149.1 four-helix bundle copper-binding protein [Ralstonia insidiosa]